MAKGDEGKNTVHRAAELGEQAILTAYGDRRSDLIVEASGTVYRVLTDDLEGARHQRFLLELSSGHTILICHNIDIAPRINNLREGDTIRFCGEYEWNERGGILHWTHHDPKAMTIQMGGFYITTPTTSRSSKYTEQQVCRDSKYTSYLSRIHE